MEWQGRIDRAHAECAELRRAVRARLAELERRHAATRERLVRATTEHARRRSECDACLDAVTARQQFLRERLDDPACHDAFLHGAARPLAQALLMAGSTLLLAALALLPGGATPGGGAATLLAIAAPPAPADVLARAFFAVLALWVAGRVIRRAWQWARQGWRLLWLLVPAGLAAAALAAAGFTPADALGLSDWFHTLIHRGLPKGHLTAQPRGNTGFLVLVVALAAAVFAASISDFGAYRWLFGWFRRLWPDGTLADLDRRHRTLATQIDDLAAQAVGLRAGIAFDIDPVEERYKTDRFALLTRLHFDLIVIDRRAGPELIRAAVESVAGRCAPAPVA